MLTLTLRDRYLHLAVSDGSQRTPRQRTPEADGGRGLLIVEGLSVVWGAEVTAVGKRVWATLSAE